VAAMASTGSTSVAFATTAFVATVASSIAGPANGAERQPTGAVGEFFERTMTLLVPNDSLERDVIAFAAIDADEGSLGDADDTGAGGEDSTTGENASGAIATISGATPEGTATAAREETFSRESSTRSAIGSVTSVSPSLATSAADWGTGVELEPGAGAAIGAGAREVNFSQGRAVAKGLGPAGTAGAVPASSCATKAAALSALQSATAIVSVAPSTTAGGGATTVNGRPENSIAVVASAGAVAGLFSGAMGAAKSVSSSPKAPATGTVGAPRAVVAVSPVAARNGAKLTSVDAEKEGSCMRRHHPWPATAPSLARDEIRLGLVSSIFPAHQPIP